MTVVTQVDDGGFPVNEQHGKCDENMRGAMRAAVALLVISLVACGGGANTSTNSPQPSALPPSSIPLGTVTTLTSESMFEGYHERNTCDVIGGWVYDKTNPDAPVSVEVFAGESLLSRLVANVFRQDLRDAGKGNGNHSFSLPTPPRIKDGQPHQIVIRIAGTSLGLRGTPMMLTCPK